MKTQMLLLIAVLLFGVVAVSAQKTADGGKGMKGNANEQAIMEKERMAWDNLKNKKYDDFAKMFADNYQGVYEDGVVSKSQEVDGVKMFDFKNVALTDMKVVFPNADVAIVTYRVVMEGTPSGGSQAVSQNLRASTVWIKRGGHWMVYLHQHMPVKQ